MEFTEEEKRILKLVVADIKAKTKLNIANLEMGTEIRAEFSTIDSRIRAEHEPAITPLQADVKKTKDDIIAEFS